MLRPSSINDKPLKPEPECRKEVVETLVAEGLEIEQTDILQSKGNVGKSVSGSEDVKQTQIQETTSRIKSKKISGVENDQKEISRPSRTEKSLKPEVENRTEILETLVAEDVEIEQTDIL
jgi:hypothetical protein